MGMPWEAGEEEVPWGDREAWRGALHAEDSDAWRSEPALGQGWWVEGEEERDEEIEIEIIEFEADAEWPEDWPEDLAGPEYWMFKRDGEG